MRWSIPRCWGWRIRNRKKNRQKNRIARDIRPVGVSGEAILDYSVFDAKRAGFKRVIFLIKHEIEADFKRVVGAVAI